MADCVVIVNGKRIPKAEIESHLDEIINGFSSGGNPPIDNTVKNISSEEPESISIRNSAVDERRLNAGLKPVLKEAKKKFGKTWKQAADRVVSGTTDPRLYVSGLFGDLKNISTRSFSDVDNAIVLMDRIDLTNQKKEALSGLDKAEKTGNDYAEALAWNHLAGIEQLLQQNDEVADKIGTSQGRALSSRRLLSYMDYTLASMKRDISKFYKNNSIPSEVSARLEKIEAEHAEAVKKLDELERKWRDKEAEDLFKKQNEKPKGEHLSKLSKDQKKVVADKLRSFAEKVEKFGRADLPEGTERQGFDIQKNIADAIRYIADKIESGDIPELLAAAIKKFGGKDVDEKELHDKIKEGLIEAGIDEKSIDEKTQKEKLVSKISELAKNAQAQTITKEMVTPLRRLVNDYARNGETDFGKVVDQVHSDLKDHFSDLTKEDIRDAYSGYGDAKLDSRSEVSKQILQWKKEAKLLGQLDDVSIGEKPMRGTRRTSSAKDTEKVENLRKELEKNMREAGIEWTNSPSTPEEKNSRALQSLKTRLQTEIEHLTSAIENGKELPENGKTILDDEAKALKKQRDDLKEVMNKIIGKENKKTLTDEQRVGRAKKYLSDKIDGINEDLSKADEMKMTDKDKDMLRARRNAFTEMQKKLGIETDIKSTESAIALEKYKDRIRNKLLELDRKTQNGEFEPTENKKAFENDSEAKILELQKKRAEVRFTQEKIKAEKENLPRIQKIYNKINQWKRFSVLTGIPTIGKLFTAITYRNVINPIEEIAGVALQAIPGVRAISKMAPREGGGFNFEAEGAALKQWIKADTWKDAWRVVKEGQSELDYRFGKYVSASPEALEVMGRLHGAMKNFAKRNEFARSYIKRMDWATDHGASAADPLTQLTAQSQAYIDANRNIFMQDNWLVNQFNKAVREGEKSENSTARAAAFMTRFLLPIVKIPTNFVGESLNYSFGALRLGEVAVRGAREILNRKFETNLKGAISDMSPEAADNLLRSLKKGSLGAVAMAMGFFVPNLAGGYYLKGKKVEGETDWGEISIGGVTIPKWATHFPLFEAMQLGATMRKVFDRDAAKGKTGPAALGDGVVRSARGLIGEVPFFRFPEELTEGIEGGSFMDKVVYPEIGSNIPIVLQWGAGKMDTPNGFDLFGDPVKRTPTGFTQSMEYRIPGLRQNVPTKEEAAANAKEERDAQKQY